MQRQDRLNLGREDVEAADVDELLQAAGDAEVAVVDLREVAGPEPAVVERGCGLLRPSQVAGQDPAAADLELPVDRPQLDAGKRAAGRRPAPLGRIARPAAGDRTGLRQPVEVQDTDLVE